MTTVGLLLLSKVGSFVESQGTPLVSVRLHVTVSRHDYGISRFSESKALYERPEELPEPVMSFSTSSSGFI